jgi:hypothetical protein
MSLSPRFVVPPRYYSAMCMLLASLGLSMNDRHCVVFIQHKFIWVDPRFVISMGIPVDTVSHLRHFFMFTYKSYIFIFFHCYVNIQLSCTFLSAQIIQLPGDIVCVLPNAVHWGVNLGLNINEAVNVASTHWALPGMLCPERCQCPE